MSALYHTGDIKYHTPSYTIPHPCDKFLSSKMFITRVWYLMQPTVPYTAGTDVSGAGFENGGFPQQNALLRVGPSLGTTRLGEKVIFYEGPPLK